MKPPNGTDLVEARVNFARQGMSSTMEPSESPPEDVFAGLDDAAAPAAGPSDAADVPAAPPAAPSAPPPLPVDPLLLQLADAEFQAEDDRLKAALAEASQRLSDTEAAAASAEAPLLSTFVGMGMTSDGALLLKQVKANPLDFEMDHRPVARHLAECLTARDDAAKALADVRHELEWLQDARGDREFAAMSRLRLKRLVDQQSREIAELKQLLKKERAYPNEAAPPGAGGGAVAAAASGGALPLGASLCERLSFVFRGVVGPQLGRNYAA